MDKLVTGAIVFLALFAISAGFCMWWSVNDYQSGYSMEIVDDSTMVYTVHCANGRKIEHKTRFNPNERNEAVNKTMLGFNYQYLNDEAKKRFKELDTVRLEILADR